MSEKIVITAISSVTPIGADCQTIGDALENGVSGIGYVDR